MSAEVVKTAPRLIGFCSANPLRQVALKVMSFFADAAERNDPHDPHDPHMRNLSFDTPTNFIPEIPPADAALVAQRIRQVGPRRILRTKVPLTRSELQQSR